MTKIMGHLFCKFTWTVWKKYEVESVKNMVKCHLTNDKWNCNVQPLNSIVQLSHRKNIKIHVALFRNLEQKFKISLSFILALNLLSILLPVQNECHRYFLYFARL